MQLTILLIIWLKKVNIAVKWWRNKKIVITKKDNEDFKNSSKYWICDSDNVDNDVKVRDQIEENIEALHIEIVISILN